MFFILKAILLWCAIFGYCAIFKKYMNSVFTPIFTLSLIGVIIFLAGLLNVMAVSVILIVLGGWACLISCKPWEKKFFVSGKSVFLTFLTFSAICCVFLLRVYNQSATHYDCYSHWLTVVREMLNTDKMPNFQSAMIMFQGYPTGSAGFIYFICKFLGGSRDDLALFAQSLLYAASITTFGAFFKRRDGFGFLIAALGALFCVSAEQLAVEYLLVDTLISLTSIGVVAIVIYYRDNILRGVLVSLPLQLFLVATKNSGIIMVAINFVLVCALAIASDYTAKGKLSGLNIVKLGGITAGLPAMLYYLWMRHVDYVFINGSSSKHTASFENYKQILNDKTQDQIKEIVVAFIKRFFSWNNAWYLLIIISAIIFVGWLIKKYILHKKSKAELFVFLGVFAAYFTFMAVLAVMYLLSMPYDEAIVLSCYNRYENTILIYIVGAITIYALSLIDLFPNDKKGNGIKVLILLLVSSLLLLQTANIKTFITKTDNYTNSSRAVLEQIRNNYDIDDGKQCFIYVPNLQDSEGYYYFLARYVLWTPNVHICTSSSFEGCKNGIKSWDYLIVTEHDDQINNFLSSYDIDINKQVYPIKEVLR